MKLFKTGLIALLVLASTSFHVLAKDYSSDKIRPQWIKTLPTPKNESYRFILTHINGAEKLESARVSSKKELTAQIEKEESIKVKEKLEDKSIQGYSNGEFNTGESEEIYSLQIESEGKVDLLNYIKIAEYYEKSERGIQLYTLYAIARKGHIPSFDDVQFTPKYGARGLVRSMIIPGWGQMYKGSTVKGLSILGGEIACGIGILVCENTRASYLKKMREQPNYATQYNSNADTWANYRNACIGVAAALYVYNLVDALVANGAERAVVKKKQYFSLKPSTIRDANGISLCYNF